ncbi:MAG: DUF4160 domain-containing protein [Flavisolibacter sp.]|nr:DUF4160 domain-containing protein [Flavisolibacter sp.]MBD0351370.1 DUF4160 domain-containing protein [Flavisolibacter sp.]
MPQLCRFYGIIIYLYFQDHNPSHFQAWYGGQKCEIGINDFEVLSGSLPRRALALVLEWASMHRDELRENWKLAQEGKELKQIEPLP